MSRWAGSLQIDRDVEYEHPPLLISEYEQQWCKSEKKIRAMAKKSLLPADAGGMKGDTE